MRIQKLQAELDNHTENQKVVAQVNDVAEAVERMTGIPVSQMGASDIERLKGKTRRNFPIAFYQCFKRISGRCLD